MSGSVVDSKNVAKRRPVDAGGAAEGSGRASPPKVLDLKAVPVLPMLEEGARFDREEAQADVNPGPMRHTERERPELEWRAGTGRYSVPDIIR